MTLLIHLAIRTKSIYNPLRDILSGQKLLNAQPFHRPNIIHAQIEDQRQGRGDKIRDLEDLHSRVVGIAVDAHHEEAREGWCHSQHKRDYASEVPAPCEPVDSVRFVEVGHFPELLADDPVVGEDNGCGCREENWGWVVRFKVLSGQVRILVETYLLRRTES